MKVLGLDLGTNSIGWAVVDDEGRRMSLVDKGAVIFEKGVGEEKNVEFSRAAERTGYRSARRIKFRRKLRKIETLKVLSNHGLCPELSGDQLRSWRYDKKYPESNLFKGWLNCVGQSKVQKERSPYYCRYVAVTRRLDLNKEFDRWLLGRAFYHIAQRRGYKSNRVAGEDKDGAVMGAIKELHDKMNGRTLGQFYYEECIGDEAVRGAGHYTSRKDYVDEFRKICEFQDLDAELVKGLERAIFFQRPLKSQKGLVGKCLLESGKSRVPVSHPAFERFRLLQFVNNIKIREPVVSTYEPRFLNEREREIAIAWLSKQKKNEKFEKLAKKLLPRKAQIEFGGKWNESDTDSWVFNYRKDMAAPGSPFTSMMIASFGDGWKDTIYEKYEKSKGKTKEQVVNDIWHALFSFDDSTKLGGFLVINLKVDEEVKERLCKPLPQGYGNLCLKAVNNILYWLEQGKIYSQSVFLAKLPEIFKRNNLNWDDEKEAVEEIIADVFEKHGLNSAIDFAVNSQIKNLRGDDYNESNTVLLQVPENLSRFKDKMMEVIQSEYGERRWGNLTEEERRSAENHAVDQLKEYAVKKQGEGVFIKGGTLENRIKQALIDRYGFAHDLQSNEGVLDGLYHPSAVECYPKTIGDYLGSPRINSIKNPVFMRTMTILRKLINALLKEGIIDEDTRIRIEMARELNNANDRAALYSWQRDREKERVDYARAIEENGYEASPVNILKYKLWMEQGTKCLYTNKTIGLHDFLGENPVYEIEHTIPRSRRLDNSQENLTLCEMHFNRHVKRNFIPQELQNSDDIFQRAKHAYQSRIDELEAQMERSRSVCRAAQEKDTKDKARKKFLKAKMDRDYLRGKLKRFEIKEPPNGFTNNQLVDTRIISKYAFLYLKSYFKRVDTLKAGVVHEVKDIWGLKDKSRDNHVHHAIDAVVVACLNKDFYDQLAHYYEEFERFNKYGESEPEAPQPWDGFDRYLNAEIQNEVLIAHLHKDDTLKQTYKKLRKRGKLVCGEDGTPLMVKGDSARGQLHQETVYGVIQLPPEKGKGGAPTEKKSVVRKFVRDLDKKDIDNIVDPVVREAVRAQFEDRKEGVIWLNKEKGVSIKKVRLITRSKVDSLIPIRKHRDAPAQDYKSHQMVANGSNYITALYRGEVNGNPKASWKVVSAYEAVKAQRLGLWEDILPKMDDKGLELKHVLKSGTHVLFLKNSPDELKGLGNVELLQRLYWVSVMEGNRIKFNYNQTALSAKDLGDGSSKIDWDGNIQNRRYLSVNGINILVEGSDFELDIIGRVIWKE